MLQPFVTFKAKTDCTIKDIHHSQSDVIITVQPKGWMDGSLMLRWIDKVLVEHKRLTPTPCMYLTPSVDI